MRIPHFMTKSNSSSSVGAARLAERASRASMKQSRAIVAPELHQHGSTVPSHYHLPPHIVRHRIVVPVNTINQGTLTALRYAQSLSSDVTAVHVSHGSSGDGRIAERLAYLGRRHSTGSARTRRIT